MILDNFLELELEEATDKAETAEEVEEDNFNNSSS